MKPILRRIAAIGACIMMAGVNCALFQSKEARYLSSAVNRATEDEVRQRLGNPIRIVQADAQRSVWEYEIREYVEGGNNSWTMTGTWWCDDYDLTFDHQGVLRKWTHRSRRC